MRRLKYLLYIALARVVSCTPHAWKEQHLNAFGLRQEATTNPTCGCPPPATSVFVIPFTTTVSVSVIASGTITQTASPPTETAEATTTLTSTVLGPELTTCIIGIQKRQAPPNTAALSGTGISSTTTITSTETATIFFTDVTTLLPTSTFTETSFASVTVVFTSTPTVINCIYVTITTISGTADTASTTTLADPSDTAPGTVEVIVPSTYSTITSLQLGTTIQTATITSTAATQTGLDPGTILIINPNYVATTITSGTTGATSVVATADGPQQGTVVVALPTPNSDCNNRGIQYAIQSNPYIRGLQADDPTYSSFSASPFQTAAPQATGVTNYLGISFVGRGGTGSIYGNPPQPITGTAVNHRAYLFAKLSGTFTFDFPLSDDITLLWVGPNAYGPNYRRATANIEQLYNGGLPISAQTRYTYNVTLEQGQYVPFRILWANAQFDGEFDFQIYAPDGELVTNSSAAFVNSPFVVQYSCDGVLAPPFVPFGQEGPGTPGTTSLPPAAATASGELQ